MFVEAKALGKSLTDKVSIAQAVNYANNEGVVWCVLTNGLVYQVYKSNEPVAMDRKLLLEIDIRDADDDANRAQVAAALSGALSRDTVAVGRLDEVGEVVFTDMRVRQALAQLAADPPKAVLVAMSDAVEGPKIEADRLRASLERIFGQLAATRSLGAIAGMLPELDAKRGRAVAAWAEPETAATEKTYAVRDHLTNKPSAIVELFQRVDTVATALGPDVSRRPTKLYIGYFVGKRSFCTLEIQKSKILVFVSVPPSEAEGWSDEDMRDVTNIGHFGMGDTELALRSEEQLSRLESLLRQSYLRNRG